MNFTKLVPSIFYEDVNEALKLFVDCLEFAVTHSEPNAGMPFFLLEKGDLQLYLFEDAQLAKEHNPELRLVTNNIQEVYDKVSTTHPKFLHPNLKVVTLRPWGAKEFALMDSQLGIRIQQW
ncbi:hypothetical protein GCM10027049_14960 [Mucilaginibacter puniceus]